MRRDSLIEAYGAFAIDLDGVLYLMDTPVPGAVDAVREIQASGKAFVFLTNNSSATPAQYVGKLAGMGLEVSEQNVLTAAQVLGAYLEREAAGLRTAFVIGEAGLIGEVSQRGFTVLEGEAGRDADMVLVGWDRHFDFEKLKTAVLAIRAGAFFAATNDDATYPTPGGLWPGAGSLVAAVRTGGGREPYIAGKPNPLMVRMALGRMGVSREETLLIGDRLETDIQAGLEAGVDTLLVLSGVSSGEDVERTGLRPTHVRRDLGGLL